MSRRQTARPAHTTPKSIEDAVREAVSHADGTPNGDILVLAFVGACGYRARIAGTSAPALAELISEAWFHGPGRCGQGTLNATILVAASLSVYLAGPQSETGTPHPDVPPAS